MRQLSGALGPGERRILGQGEIGQVDGAGFVWCLRLLTVARYDQEEDEFEAATYYARAYDPEDEDEGRVPRATKRNFGFLYLRALRTGSRALSLERGSLLDVILRIQSLQTGIWEHVRRRLEALDPPIEEGAAKLTPVLRTIEARLAEYIAIAKPGEATRLFVSQLTSELCALRPRLVRGTFVARTHLHRRRPWLRLGQAHEAPAPWRLSSSLETRRRCSTERVQGAAETLPHHPHPRARELPPIPPPQKPARQSGQVRCPQSCGSGCKSTNIAVRLQTPRRRLHQQSCRAARSSRKSQDFPPRKYAEAYCRISSYLQSMANQGYNPLVAIQIALAGACC